MKICAYNVPKLKSYNGIISLLDYIDVVESHNGCCDFSLENLRKFLIKSFIEINTIETQWNKSLIIESQKYLIPHIDYDDNASYFNVCFVHEKMGTMLVLSERPIRHWNNYWNSKQRQFDQNKLLDWFYESIDFVSDLLMMKNHFDKTIHTARVVNIKEASPEELQEYERIKYSKK